MQEQARPDSPRRAHHAARRGFPVGLALFLTLILLLPTVAAQASTPDFHVKSSTYRVDMGITQPGQARVGEIELFNPQRETVRVKLVHEGVPSYVALDVNEFTLLPAETRLVQYRFAIPEGAQPGSHGESLKMLVGPDTDSTTEAGGRLLVGTAIIFTARVTSVGVSSIEGPRHILPTQSIAGRVIVVNTWNATVNATPFVRIVDVNGTAVWNLTLPRIVIAPGATVASDYNFTSVNVSSGAYRVRGTLQDVDPLRTPISKVGLDLPVSVGLRRGGYTLVSVADGKDGDSTVTLRLENLGTVPITLNPRLVARMTGTEVALTFDLDPVTLAPGEIRLINATLGLPMGALQLSVADSDSSNLGDVLTSENLEFTVVPAASLAGGTSWLPFWVTLLGVFLVGFGSFWLAITRRRRALRRLLENFAASRALPPRAHAIPVGGVEEPRPEARAIALPLLDDLDLLLERLDATPLSQAVAVSVPASAHARSERPHLFVDLDSLGTHEPDAMERMLTKLRENWGSTLQSAVVYATAPDDVVGSTIYDAAERAGFTAHVHIGARRATHVTLVLDAVALQPGDRLIIVTHDAAFAPLARRLPAGVLLEVAGAGTKIPVDLRERASRVHRVAFQDGP